MHYAFPHWSVNTGLCLNLNEQGLTGTNYPYLTLKKCAGSNQVFIFDYMSDTDDDIAQLRLLTDPDKCMTYDTSLQSPEIIFMPCSASPQFMFNVEKRVSNGPDETSFIIHAAYNNSVCLGTSNGVYDESTIFQMVDCERAAPLGMIASEEKLGMDLVLDPVLVDFQYTSLGETFMGNPGKRDLFYFPSTPAFFTAIAKVSPFRVFFHLSYIFSRCPTAMGAQPYGYVPVEGGSL